MIDLKIHLVNAADSILEALHRLEELPDFETLKRKLPIYVDDYNNRPHCSLKGLTPNEVYNGIIIDKQNLKTKFIQARSHRIIQNRLTRCQNHD
mgnify:CR=1 FL=1